MFAWASVVAWCFKNWKILAIGSLVLISWGGLAYWGHEKYVDGKKEGLVIATAAKKALADEQAAHRKDQLEWVATSQAIERHNAEIIVHKNAEIAILTSRFTETQKSLNQQKVKNAELAKQVFDPNEVIRVPHRFSVLYNAATQDHHSATGLDGTNSLTKDSLGMAGVIDTFDAITFTQTIVGNVEKYNEESLKCDTLKELIKKATDIPIENHDTPGSQRSP